MTTQPAKAAKAAQALLESLGAIFLLVGVITGDELAAAMRFNGKASAFYDWRKRMGFCRSPDATTSTIPGTCGRGWMLFKGYPAHRCRERLQR